MQIILGEIYYSYTCAGGVVIEFLRDGDESNDLLDFMKRLTKKMFLGELHPRIFER